MSGSVSESVSKGLEMGLGHEKLDSYRTAKYTVGIDSDTDPDPDAEGNHHQVDHKPTRCNRPV